jgi:undecaprenyl-diphosphatase
VDAAAVLALYHWASSQPTLAGAIALIAESGIFLLPIVLVLVLVVPWLRSGSADDGVRDAVLAGFIAAAVALALGLVLERVLSRPRPFVTLGIVPLFPHAADSSFPSDHTLVGVALVGPLLWRAPRLGLWLFLWAVIIGLARVAAGVHYPSDVAGSILLAGVVDAFVWLVVLPPILDRLNLRRLNPLRSDARPVGSPPGERRR